MMFGIYILHFSLIYKNNSSVMNMGMFDGIYVLFGSKEGKRLDSMNEDKLENFGLVFSQRENYDQLFNEYSTFLKECKRVKLKKNLTDSDVFNVFHLYSKIQPELLYMKHYTECQFLLDEHEIELNNLDFDFGRSILLRKLCVDEQSKLPRAFYIESYAQNYLYINLDEELKSMGDDLENVLTSKFEIENSLANLKRNKPSPIEKSVIFHQIQNVYENQAGIAQTYLEDSFSFIGEIESEDKNPFGLVWSLESILNSKLKNVVSDADLIKEEENIFHALNNFYENMRSSITEYKNFVLSFSSDYLDAQNLNKRLLDSNLLSILCRTFDYASENFLYAIVKNELYSKIDAEASNSMRYFAFNLSRIESTDSSEAQSGNNDIVESKSLNDRGIFVKINVPNHKYTGRIARVTDFDGFRTTVKYRSTNGVKKLYLYPNEVEVITTNVPGRDLRKSNINPDLDRGFKSKRLPSNDEIEFIKALKESKQISDNFFMSDIDLDDMNLDMTLFGKNGLLSNFNDFTDYLVSNVDNEKFKAEFLRRTKEFSKSIVDILKFEEPNISSNNVSSENLSSDTIIEIEAN
jgi:hypothetical protein